MRSKANQKLVVTTDRVLAFDKGLVGVSSEDYGLDNITSIEFDSGLRSSVIHLQGSGIDDTYPATKKHGQAFVNAVRKQMRS